MKMLKNCNNYNNCSKLVFFKCKIFFICLIALSYGNFCNSVNNNMSAN
jgi:hypothetical protein